MPILSRQRNVTILAIVFTLLVFAGQLTLIMIINDGHIIYSLDDPYIHLAVAEEIIDGGYGINSSEYSAPSSSIFWPFLLVPFVALGIGSIAPLLLNILATCFTVWLYVDLIFIALDQSSGFSRHRLSSLTILLAIGILVVFTNLIPAALNGMEHSAQTMLAVAVLWGMVRERNSGKITPLLAVAIVVGPLIRYEHLALTVPALVLLFWRGHRRAVLVMGTLTVLPLIAFSAFLLSLGLDPLPGSVLSHSRVMRPASHLELASIFTAITEQFERNILSREGQSILALIMLLVAYLLSTPRTHRDRALVLWALAAGSIHMLVGRTSWFGRYEGYIWTILLLTLVFVSRPLWNRALARFNTGTLVVVLLAFAQLTSRAQEFPRFFRQTFLGTNNIYEQHYQMHRFVTDFYRGPVAVNDLGWVSYQNDYYVLDLWGLGNEEARQHRQNEDDPAWMDELATRYDIELAMIYTDWFEVVPEHWIPVAELYLGNTPITPGGDPVTFLALDPAALPRIEAALDAFEETLPDPVELVRLTASQEQ